MRIRNLTLGLFLVVFLFAAAFPLFADDGEITWFGDYRQALQEARQTHKPIFLEFRCEA